MQRHHYRTGITLVALALGGMLPAFGASPAPTITGYAAASMAGMSITSAPPGASLLILGANFGTSPGTVAFAGVPAPTPANWSPTQITVSVPVATSYPATGPVTVTANGESASGPAFTITAPPVLRPGDLDPTFGTGGKVLTALGSSGIADAEALALQPDGRIVVAGDAGVGGKAGVALARYNVDGSLDTGFGTGGKVLTGYSGYAIATALALQPDGRIVVAGRILVKGKNQFGLARYNINGTLDPSFGTKGTVETSFDGNAEAFAVAVQPDGRIVVAGAQDDTNLFQLDVSSSFERFALARYNADGSPDASFGTSGIVLTDFGGGGGAGALALQPDGQILVGGGGNGQFALARYQADGSLDDGFGMGGTALTSFGNGAWANAIALQPDGRIVAAGVANSDTGPNQFGLARYNMDGSLDTGFGTGGMVLTDFGDRFSGASSVALQPDRRIVVAGGHSDASSGRASFTLARYNGDGSLDTGFGTSGTVLTSFRTNSNAAASAMALQPDGQIIAAGTFGNANFSSREFVLARYQGR